ncbi:MAG: hypothetical protein R2692_01515 [Microbacterium sp.]
MASSLRPPLTRRSPEEVGIPSAALVALAERLHDEGLDPHALLSRRARRRGRVRDRPGAVRPRPAGARLLGIQDVHVVMIGFLADEGRLSLMPRSRACST